MKSYIGTKKLLSISMSRQEYLDYRGWKLPSDEIGSDEGYLVEYMDGGIPNHIDHNGYISWSPKDVFENSYQSTEAMNFGHAIQIMKDGHKVARSGWNGKNMFIVLMPKLNLPSFDTEDTNRKVNDRTAKWIGEDKPLDCQPYFAMYTANEKWQPGWLASQADMLAEDWYLA